MGKATGILCGAAAVGAAAALLLLLYNWNLQVTIGKEKEEVVHGVSQAEALLAKMPDEYEQEKKLDKTGTVLLTISQQSTIDLTASAVQASAVAALCDDTIQQAVYRYREQLRLAQIKASIQNAAGYSGRLMIPALGIDVMLITATTGMHNLQQIVDMENTACFMLNYWGKGEIIIADHAIQDFGPLLRSWVGMTAYIYTDTEIIELQSVAVKDGAICGVELTADDGSDLMMLGTYIAYTCRDYDHNIRAVGFNVVSRRSY